VPRAEDTDWIEIERLYAALDVLAPSPVVRLNRAVAVAKVRGPETALAMLQPLQKDLERYRPFHSVRAALLEERGDLRVAIAALEAALACEPTRIEAVFLTGKIDSLKKNLEGLSG
jgi:RNA polymerase sigma-70 factor (ECF subfamily)